MIRVVDLSYTYPHAKEQTLKRLNFDIDEGEIFGFLGPSGAGKSTTQNILIGLRKAYEGHIEVFDRELRTWGQDYYERIGISFELPNHFLRLTATENLSFFRSLYTGETLPAETVLDWVGLAADADKPVSDFSKGMKIRLNVARSLIHKPALLFLDEPTSGLDPTNARSMKNLLMRLRDEGTTVFISTHDMMVADELCDRVAFITAGQIDLIESPTLLKKKFGERKVVVEYLAEDEELKQQSFDLDGLQGNAAFIEVIQSANRIETIHTQESTLEKIFIQVTGHTLS